MRTITDSDIQAELAVAIKPTIFVAEWTGEWPCLCHGTWKLYRNGMELSIPIPFNDEDGYGRPAMTSGMYFSWSFNEDWNEVWDSYLDGFDEDDWIAEHHDWLASFAEEEEFSSIFKAFQSSDWRHSSCGGCI